MTWRYIPITFSLELHLGNGSTPIALDREPNVFHNGGLLFYFSAGRSLWLTGQLANNPKCFYWPLNTLNTPPL